MSCLDPYIVGRSFLHKLDPRAKLLAITALVAAIALTPPTSWMWLGAYGLIIVLLAAWARLPLQLLPRRVLVTLPFTVPAALFLPFIRGGESLIAWQLGGWHLAVSLPGLELASSVVARAWLAVMALSILAATTRMGDITRGLEKLHAPGLMINLLGFTFRYLFVLHDEARHLKAGRDLRYFSGKIGPGIRSVGFMAGSLFLRTAARSERVYGAMFLRGYDGSSRSLNPLRFKAADFVFSAGAISIVIGIYLAGWRL